MDTKAIYRNALDTEVIRSDRRNGARYVDGSLVDMEDGQGGKMPGRIMDVNHSGARLWSRSPLPENRPVMCRVNYLSRQLNLALRIVWKRKVSEGYEYGACHVAVPGRDASVDKYLRQVLQRQPLSA